MKILASLGQRFGNWLGVPSPESLGLPSNVREIVAAHKAAMTTTATAATPAPTASVASLPTPSGGASKAGVAKMTLPPRRTDPFARAMASATMEELAEEFDFMGKYNAAPSTVEKAKVRESFHNYAHAYRVRDYARCAELLKTSAAASAKLGTDTVLAKAAKPAPATDDDGTPVRTPAPDDNDDEPSLADILPDAIKSLEDLIEVLKNQMPDGSTDDDDDSLAKAKAALAKGHYAKALSITTGRLQAVGERHKASRSKGSARAVADANWFSKIRPKADYVPAVDLPADPHNVRPSAAINEKYRAALAILDAEISACVAQSRPISQQLLARRNSISREWIAINRRKN